MTKKKDEKKLVKPIMLERDEDDIDIMIQFVPANSDEDEAEAWIIFPELKEPDPEKDGLIMFIFYDDGSMKHHVSGIFQRDKEMYEKAMNLLEISKFKMAFVNPMTMLKSSMQTTPPIYEDEKLV